MNDDILDNKELFQDLYAEKSTIKHYSLIGTRFFYSWTTKTWFARESQHFTVYKHTFQEIFEELLADKNMSPEVITRLLFNLPELNRLTNKS